MSAVEWVPIKDVAEAFGMGLVCTSPRCTPAYGVSCEPSNYQCACRVGRVAYLTNPRIAQLASGERRWEADASRVWQIAETLNLPLPPQFPAKP